MTPIPMAVSPGWSIPPAPSWNSGSPKSETARDVSIPRRFGRFSEPHSDELEVDCLGAALVGFDVEADPLAFVEAAQTRRLDRRDMDEHVLAAAFRCDESKALGGIKEFDLSGRHYGFLLKAFQCARDTMSRAWSKSRHFSGKASSSLQGLSSFKELQHGAHETSPARAALISAHIGFAPLLGKLRPTSAPTGERGPAAPPRGQASVGLRENR